MTTKKTVIIFIIAFFLFTFIGRAIMAQNDLQDKLQEFVNAELAAYLEKVPDYPGGLAMEVYISGQPAIPRPLRQPLFYCFINKVNLISTTNYPILSRELTNPMFLTHRNIISHTRIPSPYWTCSATVPESLMYPMILFLIL